MSVRDYPLSPGVVAAIKKSREYKLGHVDGRAESATEIDGLKRALTWHERRLAEMDLMMAGVLEQDNDEPTWQERAAAWMDRHSVIVAVAFGASLAAVVGIGGAWIYLRGAL